MNFELHGQTYRRSNGLGFPQGGVCSAKFWLIAFNTAIEIINTPHIEGNGYADDCSAIAGGQRLDHLISRLEKMLKKLVAWGKTCGLKFNTEKTVAVLFTRKTKTPKRKLVFNGSPLEYSRTVRYLGIELDAELRWKYHIDKKIQQAKKILMGVSNLTMKSHSPCPKLLRWAFSGLVRPVFSYGAIVWSHELKLKHIKDKLDQPNRLALRTFCHAPRSTPLRLLEVMLDVMPLDLFCQKKAVESYYRQHKILEFGWSGVGKTANFSTSHMKYWGDYYEEIGIQVENMDQCCEV